MNLDRGEERNRVKPGMQMKELVEATGVPKSTILYYLSQGLLPLPVKASHNMAYYDPQCVERIGFIRNLQRHHRLSLAEIKDIVKKAGEGIDYKIRLELNELVFGPTKQGKKFKLSGFRKLTGLSDLQVKRLIHARLLLPLEDGRFDEEDVAMGKAFADAFSWGIQVRDLAFYVELGEKMVDREVELRHQITHDLAYEQDAEITLEMTKNARLSRSYILQRLFLRRISKMRDIKE